MIQPTASSMHLLNIILLTLPCKSLTRQTFTCPFQEENSEAEKCTGHLQELREKTTVRPIKRHAISLFKQDAVTRSEYLRVPAHHDLSPPSIWHEGQKEPPWQGVDGGLGFRDGILRGTSRKVQKSDRALLFVLGSALFFSPQHLLISNVTAFGLPKRENISSARLSAFPSGEPCL